jgi:NADPH:quinone reductase-like Zn-dependent oxidoreductase
VTALLVAATLAAAAFAPPAHACGAGRRSSKAKAPAAKKMPRSKVMPNQEGKVAVFPVRYDDDNAFSAQIARILKAKGLDVATDVRRVDTAEQFRELSTALGFAAYVDGEYSEGEARSKITVLVRNGYTGRKVAATTFRETNAHLRAEVEDKLWTKIGPAIARACIDANKPRKKDRAPLVIEAGTPLDSPPAAQAARKRPAATGQSGADPWATGGF